MDINLWKECIEFHGHECPGLAIGYRASLIAKDYLKLNFSKDEEAVCITENDACGVDAVQLITGCTLGKGNLIFKNRGKMAFTFINRENNKAIRLILKNIPNSLTREEKQKYILTEKAENVFSLKEANTAIPEKARIFSSIECEKCSEKTSENMIRLEDGKKLCLDCVSNYSRVL